MSHSKSESYVIVFSGNGHRRPSDHSSVHCVGHSPRPGPERQPANIPRSLLPHQPPWARPQPTRWARLPRLRLRPGRGHEQQHHLQHPGGQRGREVHHRPQDRDGVVEEDGDSRELRHPHREFFNILKSTRKCFIFFYSLSFCYWWCFALKMWPSEEFQLK